MTGNADKIIRYNSGILQKIFDNKVSFHREQARLPIEEKIRILVKLQEIVLKTRPVINPMDNRRVWELQKSKSDTK